MSWPVIDRWLLKKDSPGRLESSPFAGYAGELEQLVAQGNRLRQVHAHRALSIQSQALDPDCLGVRRPILRGRVGSLARLHVNTVQKQWMAS